MNTIKNTLSAAWRFLLNKAAAILLLVSLMFWYHSLPSGEDAATPYAELLYASILIVGTSVAFPLIRLLIFPEAASYAEKGHLKRELESPMLPTPPLSLDEKFLATNRGDFEVLDAAPLFQGFTPALVHYWIATVISALITLAVFATLTH